MEKKNIHDALLKELSGFDCLLISYSGGIDQYFTCSICAKALHERAKCILFDAPIVQRRAVNDAVEITCRFGLSYSILPFSIMENEEFRKNSPNRCYICKKQSARILRDQAEKLAISNQLTALMLPILMNIVLGFKHVMRRRSFTPFFH